MTVKERAEKLGVKVMTFAEVQAAGLKAYIDVYQPMAGWKARMLWLNEEEADIGPFWEPWNTGMCGYATKEEAQLEAIMWAQAEGIPVELD